MASSLQKRAAFAPTSSVLWQKTEGSCVAQAAGCIPHRNSGLGKASQLDCQKSIQIHRHIIQSKKILQTHRYRHPLQGFHSVKNGVLLPVMDWCVRATSTGPAPTPLLQSYGLPPYPNHSGIKHPNPRAQTNCLWIVFVPQNVVRCGST